MDLGLLRRPAGNDQAMTDNPRQMPRIYGAYLQVADLDRSLSFYRDVLALKVDWNDGTLAVLHGPVESADTLVIREIAAKAPRRLYQTGVTRVFLRVSDSADLDRAEEWFTRENVHYQRHRDKSADSIGLRDPDGLQIVLLWINEELHSEPPPAWLYWYRLELVPLRVQPDPQSPARVRPEARAVESADPAEELPRALQH
jgi:catechol 2,3-dioxygenase-like lactoylglutathione lyase family enzyme